MKYIVKNVLVLDKNSPFYRKKIDIEVDKGKIIRVEKNISVDNNQHVIHGNELVLSKSFVDINARSGEPDLLEAESLDTLLDGAQRGGFGYVCHIPTEGKSTQTKADILYLKSRNLSCVSQILPIGNITKDANENVIASMMEMKSAGAVAFSDGNEITPGMGVLKNAMLYSKGFGGKLMLHPEKKVLSKNGQINQGIMSIMLGYKGIPKEAEIMAVSEIIQLAKYTETEILLLNITCPESLRLISDANKKQKMVYAAMSSLHLALNEEKLGDYNTNFKINPPLRSLKDQKTMRKAVLAGEIDIIYSQHCPCTSEEKNLEFDLARCGGINIQTAPLACIETLGAENIERCIELLSTAPAQYLGINLPAFDQGISGSFVIIDLKARYTWNAANNVSRSSNSPYFDSVFNSKIVGLISNQTQVFFDSE